MTFPSEINETSTAASTPVLATIVEAITPSEAVPLQYAIQIQNGVTRELAHAIVTVGVTEEEAGQVDNSWFPALIALLQHLHQKHPDEVYEPEHWHWNWRGKIAHAAGAKETHLFFALKCQNEVQGMMKIIVGLPCRLDEHKGQTLVYIDYLATAPWNLAELLGKLGQTPRYRAIGPAMLSSAAEYSMAQNFGGRIGLHALPQAEDFYRDTCKMTDLGSDAAYDDFHYFEFSSEQALDFFEEGLIKCQCPLKNFVVSLMLRRKVLQLWGSWEPTRSCSTITGRTK